MLSNSKIHTGLIVGGGAGTRVKLVRNISCFLGYASPALKSRTFCLLSPGRLVADRHLYSTGLSLVPRPLPPEEWPGTHCLRMRVISALQTDGS